MNRFRGALIALVVLLVVGAVYGVVVLTGAETEVDPKARLFAFEQEDLVKIRLQRPDGVVEFSREGDAWTWADKQWRPSRSMVRRVAHQTHDLTARAAVAEPGPLAEYGLGDNAMTVTLGLKDGRTIEFQAGDPNPTAVSWYIRPLPGDVVYVVKKSAVDYWRMPIEDFREDRFAAIDADEVVAIEATVDGRDMAFRRGEGDRWQQVTPVTQAADLQEVRTMIGRTAALKASRYVEDAPAEPGRYGLSPPRHVVQLRAEDGELVTVHVGDVIVGTDPQERYMLRLEDNAVYQARDSFLEAFTRDWALYRDKRIVGRNEAELASLTLTNPEVEGLTLTRTPDGWRWPDGAKIAGSTPKYLGSAAADPTALAWHDTPDLAAFGLVTPAATLKLDFAEGQDLDLIVGGSLTLPPTGDRPPEKRLYVRVEPGQTVYEIEATLQDRIGDLLNEYRKKLETDAEKGLVAPDPEPG